VALSVFTAQAGLGLEGSDAELVRIAFNQFKSATSQLGLIIK
jgi:hypothetical protein